MLQQRSELGAAAAGEIDAAEVEPARPEDFNAAT